MATRSSRPTAPVSCNYYRTCLEVKQAINLPESLLDLDSRFNKCYCQQCHDGRGEALTFRDGPGPHNLYTKPIGWGRIMLKLRPQADHWKIFNNWNVAYHGTSVENLMSILEGGDLLLPGDTNLHGKTIREVDGHFNDERKPEGFNTKQVFLSPSIKYAGCDVYAKKRRVYLPQSGRYVYVRTVLQVRVKPSSCQVGCQTIGRSDPIDPPLSNDNIEWSTKARNCTIPTAVLIQVTDSEGPAQTGSICPTCKVLFGGRNKVAMKTCRNQHHVCETCFQRFKDIYGETCVLCNEPTSHQVKPTRVKRILKTSTTFRGAHRGMTSKRQERITLNIKKLDATTLTLRVPPTSSIRRLKMEIQDVDGIPVDQQKLIFARKELEDGIRESYSKSEDQFLQMFSNKSVHEFDMILKNIKCVDARNK